MTVLKRFDDALKPTKAAVVEMAKKLDAQHVEGTAVTVFCAVWRSTISTTQATMILPS